MSERCPTCGQLVRKDAQELLSVLKARPDRYVYRARDGDGWFVTYSGGHFSAEAVHALVRAGRIRPCYSECPEEAYHLGQTMDVAATLERRAIEGRKAPPVYIG